MRPGFHRRFWDRSSLGVPGKDHLFPFKLQSATPISPACCTTLKSVFVYLVDAFRPVAGA